ncbi:unnamed protein product [Fraxinus pennsylvanica]|uniref:CUE domain-containing protein n=1 Tax=Fraxinus pennsylvanica TaxID=56036 RepID=A0AAD2A2B1_9LAMI|nr:unnamed protein product [Fraxinus pennsylvanica]
MSAIVCGKRSFLEEIVTTSSPVSGSLPVSKKRCCSSATSPVRFSYSPPRSLIDQLKALFPDMDSELLEKVLEESGNNLDAAIKSLLGLRVGYAEGAEDNSSLEEEGGGGGDGGEGEATGMVETELIN